MRKTVCPMGLECVDGSYRCCNYLQCYDLTISWEIPYYIKDSALIVRSYGWRCEWDDKAHGTLKRFCPLPSGSYKVLDGSDHEDEMKIRLRKAWKDAGWAAATPIDEKPILEEENYTQSGPPALEDDIDSIPF